MMTPKLELQFAIEALSIDGHLYGYRPCPTCTRMTKALVWEFGCDDYRKRRQKVLSSALELGKKDKPNV
jgi:hypothetical protein